VKKPFSETVEHFGVFGSILFQNVGTDSSVSLPIALSLRR
jgi:hypothetical protein